MRWPTGPLARARVLLSTPQRQRRRTSILTDYAAPLFSRLYRLADIGPNAGSWLDFHLFGWWSEGKPRYRQQMKNRHPRATGLAVAFATLAASGCASTKQGVAVQTTAAGAAIATIGVMGLVGESIAVGGILASGQAGQEAFQPVFVQLAIGGGISIAMVVGGMVWSTTSANEIDFSPRVEVIEKRVEATPKKTRAVTATKSHGVVTAKVAALLAKPAIASAFIITGEDIQRAKVIWNVDVPGAAARFKDCKAQPFADGWGVPLSSATYVGEETSGGVVEHFVLTLERADARAVAKANLVELRICDEVLVLDKNSQKGLTELLGF